jgi:hypothetical protein
MIVTARSQRRPVGQELDMLYGRGMAANLAFFAAGCEVPQSDHAIVPARGKQLAIRAKGDALQSLGMPRIREPRLAGCDIK